MMPFGRGNVDFINVMQALKEVKYDGLFNLEIPGENKCPLEIRKYKIDYIKNVYEYLLKRAEEDVQNLTLMYIFPNLNTFPERKEAAAKIWLFLAAALIIFFLVQHIKYCLL
jgi:hypothetical protein